MEHGLHSPEVTVALALVAGIVAQAIARHLRVPGIVLLLVAGVLLGPDGAGVVQPNLLGGTLLTLVGFAVAVILFEGGMSLQLGRLRREGRAIRQLISIGAIVTTVGAALCARLILGWPWPNAWLFGTLVIVTGPTVITPLLRRFKVEHGAATVLEAEGVLIDAVGAVVATVALEIALSPTSRNVALGIAHVPMSLGGGAGMGLVGGFVLSQLLRVHRLIPEGLENVFTLATVLAIYQVSNGLMPESGIAAATVAGIVVGNRGGDARRDLQEFKEQLTVLFIGMLFVLLAADVRLAEVQALGMPGLVTVALLMFVVRPLNVALGTWGTELSWQQRAFIGAIGPRGIVAAAVAAFFAAELSREGIAGGTEMRAMVFLVIVVTVVVAGAFGGYFAGALGLRRATDNGFIILGAGALARRIASVLHDASGQEVLCIDTNPAACEEAQRAGLRVIYGNALKDSVLGRAQVDTRAGALALSTNTEVNILFMQRVRAAGLSRVQVAVGRTRDATTLALLGKSHGHVLFGQPTATELWEVRLRHDGVQQWRLQASEALWPSDEGGFALAGLPQGVALPLVVVHDGEALPVDETLKLRPGDALVVLVDARHVEDARQWFADHGLHPAQGTSSPA